MAGHPGEGRARAWRRRLALVLLAALGLGVAQCAGPLSEPGAPTATPSRGAVEAPAATESPPGPTVEWYTSADLGFRVAYPAGWRVEEGVVEGNLGRAWHEVRFLGDVYALGEPIIHLGAYAFGVRVAPAVAGSVAETLEWELEPVVDEAIREGVRRECCRDVAGLEATTIVYRWPSSRGAERVVALLRDGLEYRLRVFPDPYDYGTACDVAVRGAFEEFVSSLALVPITGVALTPGPTVTPVPTPAG